MAYYMTNAGILEEEYDEAINPREDMETITTFLTFTKNYCSPDTNPYKNFYEMVLDLASAGVDKVYREKGIEAGNEKLVVVMNTKGYIVLPVYKYEHSGVIYKADMSNPFSCSFDSGLVGIIYTTKEAVKKMYSVNKISKEIEDKIYKLMQSEVDYYSEWANGNVYYYRLLDKDTHEEIDSCGGFIGDIEENGIRDVFEIEGEIEYIGENL